jgi:hypothetical protein
VSIISLMERDGDLELELGQSLDLKIKKLKICILKSN